MGTERKMRMEVHTPWPNQRVERTGASRFAQRQIQRHRRLAPVADLGVRQAPTQQPSLSERSTTLKAYILTTGVIFALIALAHVWRVLAEGLHLAKDPWFVSLTVAAGGLSLWGWRVFRQLSDGQHRTKEE